MPRDYRPAGRAAAADRHERQTRRTRYAWIVLAVLLAAGLALVVFFRGVLLPFVVAVLVAYVLEPPVRWLARLRLPRPIGVAVVYAVFFTGVGLFFGQLVPRLEAEGRKLLDQFEHLLVEAPTYYRRFENAVESLLGRAVPGETGARPASGLDPYGFGPDLSERPASPLRFDVPALSEQLLGPTAPEGDALDAMTGTRPEGRPSAEVDQALSDSNLVVRRVEDGVYGIRFRESTYEFKQVGDKAFHVSVKDAPVPGSRVANLKNEIITSVRVQLEHLSTRMLSGFFELLQGLVGGLMNAAVGLVLTLLVAAYLLMEVDRFQRWVARRVPTAAREGLSELLGRLDRGLRGVVRGQLLVCLINGVLCFIGFLIFIPEYAVVFGVLAGLLSFIPIFGTIVSAIPAVFIGLTIDLMTGLWVLVWILGVHFIEANLVEPRIFGHAARISPVIVLFALMAGQATFGLAGALLAVPTAALLQALFSFVYGRVAHVIDRRLPR